MSDARITPSDVRHVAKLARLRPDEATIDAAARQMAGVLEYVAQVDKAPTDGVEPMFHALEIQNVLRPDREAPSLPLEKVLENAPAADGPFFKVPKVISTEEA